MNIISAKLTEKQIQELFQKYKTYQVTPGDYMRYSFRLPDCVINVYTSGKVVFQGKNAEKYGLTYYTSTWIDTYPQCGSDEVGTGDFFGPIFVAATIVSPKIAPQLKELGFRDSKHITDNKIQEIVPKIQNLVPHVICVIDNDEYNSRIDQENMNQLKSILHNRCYVELQKKGFTLPSLRVIDQFTPKDKYYNYIKDEPEIIQGITFKTKAEDQYLSVGVASVLARDAFLRHMDALNHQYQMEFPKGAGEQISPVLETFIQKYGEAELKKVAKLNFANYRNR